VFVTRRPVVVVVLTVLLTLVIGSFASQQVDEDGAPVDNELSAALDVVEERFGDRSAVLQVVVESTDGADVRSADALATTLDLQEVVTSGSVGDTLVDEGGQPPVVSYLAAAEFLVEEQGVDPAELDDADVVEVTEEGAELLPDEVGAQVGELLGDGDPPTAGLVLILQDTSELDTEEEELDRQRELVAALDDVDVADGIELSPLSFGLLLEDNETGAEIGRLFGTALGIILAVLAVVYFVRPVTGTRAAAVRRSAADTGLTLLVILFAVVWMQGLGSLLGPGVLDLIGPFNPQTQVVPILIVGLGVDFSIHLLARYRSETGASRDPATGYRRAAVTVGLALLLDTAATAIGFLTNLISPVEFLRTLGVLAAIGITAAFLMTMTFLPAARILLDRRADRRGRLPVDDLAQADRSVLPRLMSRTTVLAERAPVAVVTGAVVLTAVGGYGFTQLDSRFALTDFVPQDDPQLATFETLEREFGGGFDRSTEVLLRGDVATPDALDALDRALDDAAEVDGVDTLNGDADATSVLSILGRAAGEEDLGPELGDLGVSAGEDGDLAVNDDADVEELFDLLLTELPDAEEVLAEDDGDGWLGRVEVRTNVDQEGAMDLRLALQDAFAPLEDAGVEATVTSQEIVQASVSDEIETAQLQAIAIALSAVMLLLALYFGWRQRQPWIGVLTVLPVGFVLALTFGMMALTDIPLNPVTATLAALSIGIGVPFNIHVAARYLEERESHEEGTTALERSVTRTGGAVVASALTTGIGFGVLTTSTLVPFEQLGYVIVYAIVLSAVAATIVLPSLLALWERRQRTS
jgi:uncharacterized protein